MIYGITFAEYYTIDNNKKSFQVLYLTWSVFAMILVLSYCCNLRAILTNPAFGNPIVFMEDLLASDKTLSVTQIQVAARSSIVEEERKLKELNRLEETDEYTQDLVARAKIDQCVIQAYETGQDIMYLYQKKEGKIYFDISPSVLIKNVYGLMMSQDNTFAQKWFEIMMRLDDTGISQHLFRQHFPIPLEQQEEEELKPLALDSLVLGFIIWAFGIFFGLAAFSYERCKNISTDLTVWTKLLILLPLVTIHPRRILLPRKVNARASPPCHFYF